MLPVDPGPNQIKHLGLVSFLFGFPVLPSFLPSISVVLLWVSSRLGQKAWKGFCRTPEKSRVPGPSVPAFAGLLE